ncbi:methyltransferase domain-containing protein [Nocardiopsis sp. CNT-189]
MEKGPRRLAEALAAAGVLTDPAWEAAVRAVPRHRFLPDTVWPRDTEDPAWRSPLGRDDPAWARWAYEDVAVVTQVDDGTPAGPDGRGREATSSISQPSLVVAMLQALDVAGGDRVLEIGTGTGYNTALLCERLGPENVVSVEVDPVIAERARRTLAELGYKPTVIAGDGALGAPGHGPFDRVLATVAARRVPPAWAAQTRPGGAVVTPWGTGFTPPVLLRLAADGAGAARGRIVGEAPFMWLREQRGVRGGPAAFVDTEEPTEPTPIEVSPRVVAEPDAGWETALGHLVPGLDYAVYEATDDSGEASIYVFDRSESGSWALGEYTPAGPPYEAQIRGPRDLWAEVAAAREAWEGAGRPGRDRLGLTVRPDGGQVLWADSPDTVLG